MGAGAYETQVTPDLLKEAGYTYLMDWPCGRPADLDANALRAILSVPYPVEVNDSPMIVHRKHSAREFCDMVVDQFDEMLEQCVKHPLVCNISIHPTCSASLSDCDRCASRSNTVSSTNIGPRLVD